jgi:hypothetical protein
MLLIVIAFASSGFFPIKAIASSCAFTIFPITSLSALIFAPLETKITFGNVVP